MWRAALSLCLLAPTLACSSSDDAANFSWTEVAPCPVARFEALGVVLHDELWVMGGFLSTKLDVTQRVDIYDPRTNSWRPGPDLPGAETHAGVVNVGTDDFVLIGGFAGNVLSRLTTAAVWSWNGASSAWSSGPDLPTPRAATAAAIIGTRIHAAGGLAANGNLDSGEHLVWDLEGASEWQGAAALPIPRNHGGGAASGDTFYALSGRHGWDEVTGDDPAVEAYDSATDTWTARAPMPLERSEIGASTFTLPDGRVLVVGGSIPGKKPSRDVLVYDPRADSWSTLPSLPVERKGAVAARIGSSVIVTTGSPTSTDPSTNTYVGCCL